MENLPALNAAINTVAAILLVCGWRAVKRGEVEKHKKLMKCAVVASALFLTSYVIYHYGAGHTEFEKQGWIRWVYFFVLATHVPLATLMVVPILFLLHAGLTDRIERHKKLARITLPIWLYVSVTGVMVYWMLYRL